MNFDSQLSSLLELFAKGAALTLAGLALHAAMKKTSAANRHAVLAAVFATLLVLPLTKLATPRWTLDAERPVTTVTVPLPEIIHAPSAEAPAQPEPNRQPAPTVVPLVIPWQKILIATWLCGAALLLARRALISRRLRALVRGSREISDARLAAKVRDIIAAIGIRAEVRQSGRCRVPFVAGAVRPVVLLPAGAVEWSDALISSALRHELGHIRRRDCIARLLADAVCALHWPNPLVWFAARRMRLAQEQACDDIVLNSGARADEYAGHLVEVVRSLQKDHFTARHALAMAQPSTLETRVLAIVDTARDRSPRSVRGAVAGFAFVAAALALCTAAQLRGADEKKTAPAAVAGKPLRKQILIEAKFFELSVGAEGLPDSLKRFRDQLRDQDTPAVSNIFDEKDAAEFQNALKEKKGVDLLSAPRVTTASGQRCIVEIVREMRYATEWSKDAKSGAMTPMAFETKEVGITLDVEPLAGDEGNMDLQLTPQIVEFTGMMDHSTEPPTLIAKPDPSKPAAKRITAMPAEDQLPKGHVLKPVFRTQKVSTNVTVGDGNTIIIGGFDRDRGDGVKTPIFVTVRASIVKRWVFPKVEFRNAPLREVVDFLVAKSKTLEHDGKGANIIFKDADGLGESRINLSLANVPLTEVLRHVAAQYGLEIVAGDDAITLRRPKIIIESDSATSDKKTGAFDAKGGVKSEAGDAVNTLQITQREKFIRLDDGAKGLQNAPARAPLTVEVGSVSSGKRGDLTTPMGGITGTGGAGASVAAADIPPQAEVRQLAEDALLLWSEGIQNGGDFSKFYEAAADQWKNRGKSEPGGDPFNSASRLTIAALRSAFRDAIAARVDLSPIRKKKLLLSEPARVNARGVLVLRGTCEATVFQQAGAPLRVEMVIFTLEFVREEGQWKNFGITIHKSGC